MFFLLVLMLLVFSFLIFLLWTRKNELSVFERRFLNASQEIQATLVRHFLSLGEIPSKEKLVSIIASLSRKYQIQVNRLLPASQVIDNLVCYVISNDLLDSSRKRELSDRLLELKNEVLIDRKKNEVYIDDELKKEAIFWRKKLFCEQLFKVLAFSLIFLTVIILVFFQLRDRLEEKFYELFVFLLFSVSGFSLLLVCFGLLQVFFLSSQGLLKTKLITNIKKEEFDLKEKKEKKEKKIKETREVKEVKEDKQKLGLNFKVKNSPKKETSDFSKSSSNNLDHSNKISNSSKSNLDF